MSKKIAPRHEKLTRNEQASLKGTLISVFLLGLFIIISWFGVYYLFLQRL